MAKTKDERGRPTHVFPAVALLLFTAGWAANHFVSMLPVLYAETQLPRVVGDSAFGIYALGLLPGLLGGGALADRLGPRGIVLTGASTAALGNLLMAFWHSEPGVLSGRLVVGAGVGLAVSAGTAWAATLRGTPGAALAGILLTSGFASGPIVSGLVAVSLPGAAQMTVPFLLTAGLSASAVAMGLRATARHGEPPKNARSPAPSIPKTPDGDQRTRGLGRAFAAALPMSLWVFSCVTMAFVVMPARMEVGPTADMLLPGLAATLAFGAGLGLQTLARRAHWGPVTGVAGATLACLGFLLVAWVADSPALWQFMIIAVVMGSAYGLSLREGLVDVDRLAPLASRGLVIGIFYVFAYLGFGLPVLLEALRESMGLTLPVLLIAGLALTMAVTRTVHLLTTDHLKQR